MTGASDHARLREIFLGACDLPAAEQRAYLDAHCSDVPELRAQVNLMLARDEPDDAEFEVGSAVANFTPPEQIGSFRILEPLGEGGMGRVFKAEQLQPRRNVAIKILHVGLSSDRMRARFENEAEALGRLRHPGIAQVIEFGTAAAFGDRLPYMAMELIEGADLVTDARLRQLDVVGRLQLFQGVCEAVGHAHHNRVIHRDLKPSNILVASGQPKVLDFGISRIEEPAAGGSLTGTGLLVGTLSYMSPEQLTRNPPPDSRADLYSLGVVLFELLTGELPLDLDGASLTKSIELLQHGSPARLSASSPGLRGDLELIIGKCLEKSPERRYSSAEELSAEIDRYLSNQPILARAPTAFYQFRKYAQRHRALVGGGIAVLVTLILGLVSTGIYATVADERRRESERLSYRASLAAAAATVDTDPERARRHLDSAPRVHRGWEWEWVDAALQVEDLWHGDSAVVRLPDGKSLVAAVIRGEDVELVRPLEGSVLQRISTGWSDAQAPVLAGDGSRVAVYSASRSAFRVLGRDGTGCIVRVPRSERVPGAALGPKGRWFVTCGEDGAIEFRSALTGAIERSHPRGGPRHMPAFFADGRRVLICESIYKASVLDLSSGALRELKTPLWSHGQALVAPSGRRIALPNIRAVTVVETDDAATLHQFTGHHGEVGAIAFDAAGRRLATIDGKGGGTRIFGLGDTSRREAVPKGRARSLAFSGAGTLVGADARGVRAWFPGRQRSTVLRGHESFVYYVAVSPDNRYIASGSWDATIRLWDARSFELLMTIQVENYKPQGTVAFDRDGSEVLLLDPTDGVYFSWDVVTGKRSRRGTQSEFARRAQPGTRFVPTLHHSGNSGVVLPDGRLVASAHQGVSLVAPIGTVGKAGRVIWSLPAQPGSALAVSADGSRLAVGTMDGRILIWDLASQDLDREFQGPPAMIHALVFDPSGTRLAVGTTLTSIHLYELERGEMVGELSGHSGYVHGLVFSPDGTQLVSGSGDQTVRIWDTVPRHERLRQSWQDQVARESVRPWVEELRRRHPEDTEVVAAIRASDRARGERVAALDLVLRSRR